MKPPVKAHLISGPPGAGKSTYARDLAVRMSAILFCIDAWMETLFAKDLPPSEDAAWIQERTARCDALILRMARAGAAAGALVVLDLGFQRQAQRRDMAEGLAADGVAVRLHLLDLDVAARWRRIEARGLPGRTPLASKVTRAQFDALETQWEPPDREEFAALNGCLVDAASGDARRHPGT